MIDREDILVLFETMLEQIASERESISKSARLSLMRWVIEQVKLAPEETQYQMQWGGNG